MEILTIADKTFNLYKQGLRTFIHVPREDVFLKNKERLTFGSKVTLCNRETNEMLEQIFWFFFDFKENDRFIVLAFYWDTKSALFFNRKNRATSLVKNISSHRTETVHVERLCNYQRHLYNMVSGYSSFFFADVIVSEGDTVFFLSENSSKNEYFIVSDILRLKKKDDSIFEMCSLFPVGLL